MKTINEKIVDIAFTYKGKEELPGNSGFKDEKFQMEMEAVGWDKYEAWCILFVELIYRKSYGYLNSLIAVECEHLFSDSCTATFRNFKKSDWEVSKVPVKGSIAIWQLYKNGKAYWQGHAGVVVETYEDEFTTLEGNSNDNGSRNGYKVAEKIRSYDFEETNGLRLLGFIEPKKI